MGDLRVGASALKRAVSLELQWRIGFADGIGSRRASFDWDRTCAFCGHAIDADDCGPRKNKYVV